MRTETIKEKVEMTVQMLINVDDFIRNRICVPTFVNRNCSMWDSMLQYFRCKSDRAFLKPYEYTYSHTSFLPQQ